MNLALLLRKSWLWGCVGLAGLAGITWGIEWGLIQPRAQELLVLRKEIRHVGTQIKGILADFPDLMQPRLDLKKQKTELARLRQKTETLQSRLLSTPDLKAFLAGKGLPDRENFYWQSEITEESETESPPYVRQTLRIDATASYDALVAYMNSIEAASPFVDFVSLKLSPDEDRLKPLKVEILAQVTHSPQARSRWRELQALVAARP